jgi:hypothetical protein
VGGPALGSQAAFVLTVDHGGVELGHPVLPTLLIHRRLLIRGCPRMPATDASSSRSRRSRSLRRTCGASSAAARGPPPPCLGSPKL